MCTCTESITIIKNGFTACDLNQDFFTLFAYSLPSDLLQKKGYFALFAIFFCYSWTVIVRRFDESGDYNRSWDEYKQGFGDASGEYWLGNEYLHYLTSSRAYKLRFDLVDWDGNPAYAEYSSFVVESEADNYRLLLGDYSGNVSADQADDETRGFLYHKNAQFSTFDRDNDEWPDSCISDFNFGGFWHKACTPVAVTNNICGSASCPTLGQRIYWLAWQGYQFSLKKVKMMIRPV